MGTSSSASSCDHSILKLYTLEFILWRFNSYCHIISREGGKGAGLGGPRSLKSNNYEHASYGPHGSKIRVSESTPCGYSKFVI